MTDFLDSLPFDWTNPAARELRDFLASTYYRVDQVIPLLQQSGISPASVVLDAPMFQVWHNIIGTARNQNRLKALLSHVSTSADAAVANRLQELTAQKPILSADPANPTDSSSAAVTWKGFDDRKALERLIVDEDDTLLDVSFLERGLELAPSIVRLLVTLPSGRYTGTGFRIAHDLLLTNHHVLFDWNKNDEAASLVEAWFGYERDFTGRQRHYSTVRCNAESIKGERALDWAVVRTAEPIPDGVLIVELTPQRPVQIDDRVYIIQHPDGGPKQIGMHHNIVRFADDTVVQYWTDTKRGSSGSPVFSETWEVVALHHKWVESLQDERREYRNQGVRIERVRAAIADSGLM